MPASAAPLRVIRHDTGQAVEIPADSLRWGPDTGAGTCRAQLLRHPYGVNGRLHEKGDVPYFLPFSGAKFAVRVTLKTAGPVDRSTARSATESLLGFSAQLGSLLDAAADALRSEGAAGQGRLFTPADVATVQRAAAWLCTSNSPEAREIGGAMEALADRLTEAHWRGDV